jgi:hypothetical protein
MDAMTMTKITSAMGSQIGASTHHQDHVMVPMSLSTMKTMVSRPKKPMPAELLLDDDDAILTTSFCVCLPVPCGLSSGRPFGFGFLFGWGLDG